MTNNQFLKDRIQKLEDRLNSTNDTSPGESELTQECHRCLSVTGLKEFIAKHHPDYVLESRKQNPTERYVDCRQCGHIISWREHSLLKFAMPCPACGAEKQFGREVREEREERSSGIQRDGTG